MENRRGAHSFVITSGLDRSPIWGGAATTPGNSVEMAWERPEHAGSIVAMLVVDIFSRIVGHEVEVILWVDNDEVVWRGKIGMSQIKWQDTLVLDYDLWAVSQAIQDQLSYSLS